MNNSIVNQVKYFKYKNQSIAKCLPVNTEISLSIKQLIKY